MLKVSAQKQFGGFSIQAEFTASHGITALFGKSGSGKSSIANMIAGLLKPDAGIIKINEQTLFDQQKRIDLPAHDRRIGYVFQESRLFPHLSVQKNLIYGRQNRSEHDEINAGQVIELLGIGHLLERQPDSLSGGEKQRVAIGRAILSRPQALVMDEPLASLDGGRKNEILPYIERLRDHYTLPILYISHSIEEVARLADTLVLLQEGSVIAVGQPDDLLTRLDLRSHTGRFQAGATIDAMIEKHEASEDLSYLRHGSNTLRIPMIEHPEGERVKIRILARDVGIALQPIEQSSFQNQLEARIASLTIEDGPFAEIRLDIGSAHLLARITSASAQRLNLQKDQQVTAIIKSVALQSRGVS